MQQFSQTGRNELIRVAQLQRESQRPDEEARASLPLGMGPIMIKTIFLAHSFFKT